MLEPLPPGSTQRGNDESAILCRLAIAECLLETRKTAEASQWLGGAFTRNRTASRGPLRVKAERLTIIADSQAGATEETPARIGALLDTGAQLSLRRFRIALASEQVRTGQVSQRIAVDLLGKLLNDPTEVDLREAPLDSLVTLRDPNTAVFDQWFKAAVSRRDDKAMLRIADAETRRRWLASMPGGGRIASARRLLEGSAQALGDEALAAKGALLDRRRDYGDILAEADRLRMQMSLDTSRSTVRRDWEATVESREALLWQIALSRANTPLVAMPSIGEEIGEFLSPDEAVIAFRVGEEDTYAMSVLNDSVRSWKVGQTKNVRRLLTALLRAIVGNGTKQEWTPELLADPAWRESSEQLADALFRGAPVEVISASRLRIVPDGLLWYTPWNALVLHDGTQEAKTLFERGPVTVSPTIGLALAPRRSLRPIERPPLCNVSAKGRRSAIP